MAKRIRRDRVQRDAEQLDTKPSGRAKARRAATAPGVEEASAGSVIAESSAAQDPAAPASEQPPPVPAQPASVRGEVPCLEAGVREVMELYERHSGVFRFPDVDYSGLSAAASQLQELALAAARARTQLEAAQSAYDDAERRLRTMAKKGFAYATIFAQGETEVGSDGATTSSLREELAGCVFARPEKARRKSSKREPLRRRSTRTNSELPFGVAETTSSESPAPEPESAERIVEVVDESHLHVA